MSTIWGCREPSKLFVASVRMRMCLDDDVLDPDKIVEVGKGAGKGRRMLGNGFDALQKREGPGFDRSSLKERKKVEDQ